MSERKWDELNNDCLVQIFARVGTESLARIIPLVCKSWYHATFDPQCWTTLTFSFSVFDSGNNFVKYAVGRAQRSVTTIVFKPFFFTNREDLLCIAQGCPLLKILLIQHYGLSKEHSLLLSELIGSWKHLEYLQICDVIHIERILESISLHCDNFVGFIRNGNDIITKEVSAIVKFTPQIKFLSMQLCWLPRKGLMMLLKGCAALETLDVSNCIGFEEGDDEILKLASHIRYFQCSGATRYNEDESEDEFEVESDGGTDTDSDCVVASD